VIDIWVMLAFGVIGYVFKKLDYPLAPLTLALVLGDRAEDAFRQTMIGSYGDATVLFKGPLAATIMCLAILLLFWSPIYRATSRAASLVFKRPQRNAAE